MKTKKISTTLTQTVLDTIINCSLSGESIELNYLFFQRDSESFLFPINKFSESLTLQNKNFSSTIVLLSPEGDEVSSLLDFKPENNQLNFLWKWDNQKLKNFLIKYKNNNERYFGLFTFLETSTQIIKDRDYYSLGISFTFSKRFLKTLHPINKIITEDSSSLHARNLLLFGEDNFNRINQLKIGCIGAGGLMNPFVIQAMHHGYKNFVLIDPDKLEIHNCNRFYGYKNSHLGKYKVEILKEILQEFSNEIHVEVIPELFPINLSIEALSTCDVLVAGVDNDSTRLQIQILALALEKPYLDMGCGIVLKENLSLHPEVEERGGQIKLFIPGEACISCMGLNIGKDRTTGLDRGGGYIQGTDLTPPSILSLNSSLASMGIKLLTDLITETGTLLRHIKYNEMDFKLFIVKTERSQFCKVCG